MTGVERSGRSSLAVDNLRAFVILLVLSFHAALAYLASSPHLVAFDAPPFLWRAFPIVDTRHWLGFDIYCAWQDVFLMSLFFFVSGLFTWPSLKRKGAGAFLHDRILRLGLPFALVVLVLMPAAQYPTWMQITGGRGFAAYLHDFAKLPFWPSGPVWFLWLLLVGDLAAATLYRFAPGLGEAWAGLAARAAARPARGIAGFAVLAALAYAPLALLFTPQQWDQLGPFSWQLSRPLHYALYFFAGVGLGAGGIERGPFAPDGIFAGRWRRWLVAAVVSFIAWMALMWATLRPSPAPWLPPLADLSFTLACMTSGGAVLAVFLRFARRSVAWLEGLRTNAYGMYLTHYLFIIWLQYALLPAAWPAVAKFAVVFAGTLMASWCLTTALRRLPPAAQVLGGGRHALPRPS